MIFALLLSTLYISTCRTFNYFQMKMGDFVTIGQNCIIEAVSIGNGSEIEDDCIIVCPRSFHWHDP